MEMISRVNVTNMHCSNCALTIEHYFNDLKNIKGFGPKIIEKIRPNVVVENQEIQPKQ